MDDLGCRHSLCLVLLDDVAAEPLFYLPFKASGLVAEGHLGHTDALAVKTFAQFVRALH